MKFNALAIIYLVLTAAGGARAADEAPVPSWTRLHLDSDGLNGTYVDAKRYLKADYQPPPRGVFVLLPRRKPGEFDKVVLRYQAGAAVVAVAASRSVFGGAIRRLPPTPEKTNPLERIQAELGQVLEGPNAYQMVRLLKPEDEFLGLTLAKGADPQTADPTRTPWLAGLRWWRDGDATGFEFLRRGRRPSAQVLGYNTAFNAYWFPRTPLDARQIWGGEDEAGEAQVARFFHEQATWYPSDEEEAKTLRSLSVLLNDSAHPPDHLRFVPVRSDTEAAGSRLSYRYQGAWETNRRPGCLTLTSWPGVVSIQYDSPPVPLSIRPAVPPSLPAAAVVQDIVTQAANTLLRDTKAVVKVQAPQPDTISIGYEGTIENQDKNQDKRSVLSRGHWWWQAGRFLISIPRPQTVP